MGQATPFEQFRVPPNEKQTLRYVSASDAFNGRSIYFPPRDNVTVMNMQSFEQIAPGRPNPVYKQPAPVMANVGVTMDINNPMTNQDSHELRDLWTTQPDRMMHNLVRDAILSSPDKSVSLKELNQRLDVIRDNATPQASDKLFSLRVFFIFPTIILIQIYHQI